MSPAVVQYLVFDIESVADGDLVSKIRFPGQGLSATDAVAKYRAELIETTGSDFIPYTYQVPISVVAAKVGKDFRLIDIVALDEPKFRPHVITENFWRGWEKYRRPTLVTFNGRSFDLPLMEMAAFRYGLSLPGWFNFEDKNWDQHRSRYNLHSHLDLHDMLTNFGASRFSGGLNLAANLLGKPGKMEVQGHMVQDLFNAGNTAQINDYCRCDVLDTYFVFLRASVLLGKLSLDEEQGIVAETKTWLTERAEKCSAYAAYLNHWGNWPNPWIEPAAEPAAAGPASPAAISGPA